MEKSYRIPEENLATLQSRMAKLVRRCTRLKVEPPTLTVGQPEEIRYKNEDGFDRIRRVFPVTLESNGRPKVEGFEFAAVISPVTDEDGKLLGNVLRKVPGFELEIPPSFRTATNYCDHCKSERKRLETFVIYSEAGYRQVGRNCLANYLGLTNPETLVAIAEILIDADDLAGMAEDEGFHGGTIAQRVPLDEVLQVAASAIRQHGWLSNKSAVEHGKTSTSARVREWVFGSAKDRKEFEFKLIPSDEDKALATKTIEWLDQLHDVDGNDYLYNLFLLARSISVTSKNFGIAVSAINAYSKAMEFEIRRNARIEADSKSDFIGTVGERITIENAVVLYTTTFETQYGVSHFFKFKVADNILVYFASNQMFKQGETIPSMTARVKAHENRVDKYNPQGVKQTVITRAALPKPPKAPLTPEQKIAKKAVTKLRRVQLHLPNSAQLSTGTWPDGTKFEYSDYVAWGKVGELIWNIQREAGL
jgi:hypothetical protein